MTSAPFWTPAETAALEQLAGDVPLLELVRRYRRIANPAGWPHRSRHAIQLKMVKMGLPVRVNAGEWVTTGGAAEILGCPGCRVEAWLRRPKTAAILQPIIRGKNRYITRAAWRRLARERPAVLGGYGADRLFLLLEDRELAESVAARYPRRSGDWRVRCCETGKVWPSARRAAAELHVSRQAITLAIRERRPVMVLGMRFEALREGVA